MAEISDFGRTAQNAVVQKVTLRSETLTASILTYGAIVQSVRLAGVAHDLTLGSDSLADYEGDMCYYGSLVAPVVNRITGAKAQVAGHEAHFDANFLGKHCLHSGAAGVQHQVWAIDNASADEVQLSLHLPHGAGGFAGNRHVTARFTLKDAAMRMDVSMKTDAATLWNAANHSYWNLDGSASFAGHSLQIAAQHYLPTDEAFIPTGEVCAVDGTAFDFRAARVIAAQKPALDNSFCLSQGQMPLREVLVLRGARGVALHLSTTEAGVQIYDCRHDSFRGVAIEAQNWPDAPHHAGFPNIEVPAGGAISQTTEWRFGAE